MGRRPKPPKRHPSFFKILLDDFTNQLRIPPAFVKHFDGKIPRECLFCGPTERFWQVNVENSSNRLCFKKGWKKFAKDHGLELGDFLVCRYLGNSEFYVEIYGKNCCQKNGAVTSAKKTSTPLKFQRENQIKRSKTNGTRYVPINPGKVEAVDLETEDPKAFEQHRAAEHELCDRGRHSQSRHGSKGKACKREIGAIEDANKYVPNHPSFKCVMWTAYVMHGYLNVPAAFLKRHMPWQRRESSMMHLQHSRRLWPVKLCISEGPRVRFSAGWRQFVKENAVEVGDVCVFELIKRDGSLLKVSVFRS